MFDFIYIEESVWEHPRTRAICRRFPKARQAPCERYGEIFNRRGQDFRLQKARPALILAEKHGRLVLDAPPIYAIGEEHNYYFSHMLNCIYDCRYCFLQGMYRSAHLVLFVNYESFQEAIAQSISRHPGETACFFSGYDCDSLALEGVTGFVSDFLGFFSQHPEPRFELRTKSIRIQPLLESPPLGNCIVAYSLTPPAIASALETDAPPIAKRIAALRQLQEAGWPLGLRFDPLICHAGWEESYRALFAQVFGQLDAERLHSVSLGQFRLPRAHYKRIARLHPEEKLFAWGLEEKDGMVSYQEEMANEMHSFCSRELLQYIPEGLFFPCLSTQLQASQPAK